MRIIRTFVLTLAGLTVLTAATLALVHPVVEVHPSALIVNTDYSSAVIDGQGIAYAVGALTVGIDTAHGIQPWTQWADYSDSTPVGLTPVGL